MEKSYNIKSWESDGMTFVAVDNVAYVKVEDMEKRIEEIKKTLKGAK